MSRPLFQTDYPRGLIRSAAYFDLTFLIVDLAPVTNQIAKSPVTFDLDGWSKDLGEYSYNNYRHTVSWQSKFD